MTSELKYNQLIETAKSENRIKGEGVYYEGHHIVPKCVGGKGHSNGWRTHPNIVLLTAKEHFWAHVWLIDIYPDHEHKMRHALNSMMNLKNGKTIRDFEIESELYSELRTKFGLMISEKQTGVKLSTERIENIRKSLINRDHTGDNNPFYGKTHTPETIEFLRTSQKGELGPFYGKKHTPESLKKMSESSRGPKTKEHANNISKAKKGVPNLKSRKYTDEQVRLMRKVSLSEYEKLTGTKVNRSTYYQIKNKNYYKEVI